MTFNSVTFILYLTVVVLLYWLLPTTLRYWHLFFASLTFYGFWRIDYLAVMVFSAAVDFYTAQAIHDTPVSNRFRRRMLLGVTLTINLGLLAYFKYLYFFCENTNFLLQSLGMIGNIPLYKVILPFGISFYTFETISYTIDVYRGILKPERKFINYALFVTFFPKLVAGPIQRAGELIEQLKNRPPFDLAFINKGIRRILYGLFIKVVLADNISPLVDDGFGTPYDALSALDVLTLAFLFGFQIYFDFSAYSHIAVGSALLMGIHIPENFNFPYIACSFRDFWKRWHISLSAWIRDYLYLPLAGIKVGQSSGKEGIGNTLDTAQRTSSKSTALFATWAIMGFWHGANWTFLIWGLYHATAIFIERYVSKKMPNSFPTLTTLACHWTTLLVVMIGWIPFRATTVQQTLQMWSRLGEPTQYLRLGMRENVYMVAAAVLVVFYISWASHVAICKWVEPRLPALNYLFDCLTLVVCLVLVFTFLRPINQFIYFQF